jgi:LPXTG-motif cell wall-anchored protein
MRAKALRLLAVSGVAAAVMLPGAAMAQDVTSYGGGNTDSGGQGGTPGSDDASTTNNDDNESSGGSLPLTGGDAVGLALIGAGAVLGGAALARSGRRRVAEV